MHVLQHYISYTISNGVESLSSSGMRFGLLRSAHHDPDYVDFRHRQAAIPVLDGGQEDGHRQHQAEGIYNRLALAPLDFLAGIVVDRCTAPRV